MKGWLRISGVGLIVLAVSLGISNRRFASEQPIDLLAAMEAGRCESEVVDLHKMALKGDALSQLAFGHAVHEDLCNAVDIGKNFSDYWYRKSAEQGNAEAQAALGQSLIRSWNRKDEEEAFVWYRRSADQGNPHGQFGLAQLYEGGAISKNIPKNEELALELYNKSAAQGYVRSHIRLSSFYESGSGGVQKDDVKAAYWYRKAAENGQPYAQGKLAELYQEGRGVEKNVAEAKVWFGKAAAQNDMYAQESLAKILLESGGGSQDQKMAVELFRKAAEAGNPKAQYELGKIYLIGLNGVPQDESKAKCWFKRSADRWHPPAIKELEGLR
ncbi:tetratricopeptide repeat protein [Pseudomonas putida]|uniref:tetratricopeptide repeat protein n=1 Tax=Pseudomonas putida TaxID=303 RepID=UPI003D98614D